LFRTGVTVQGGVFTAFFLIQDKLQCNFCAAWPIGVRRVAAMANQVARIGERGIVGHAKS